MRKVFRLFGIPVFSISYEGFEDELVLSNVGGNYELAPAQEEDDEYWEEEDTAFGFGFRRPA